MKLQDIFDQLTSGELSQLSIGGGEMGVVPESAYPVLTRNVQLGLTALYKRFNLKESRHTLALSPTKVLYSVKPADLIKIERVLTDRDFELPLNNSADLDSCFTTSHSVLSVPVHITAQGAELEDDLRTSSLTVVYRANHPKLNVDADPANVELELPDAYTQALLLFVAARIHTPTGMTGQFSAGNNYFTRYEVECKSLETEGVSIDKTGQTSRLLAKGFV